MSSPRCPNRSRIGSGSTATSRRKVAPLRSPTRDSIRLATATCQHYETGFYAAHRDIAEWSPDLVLFLGDFIYEGAANPIGDDRVRSHEGAEPIDLDGYRARYATYLADEAPAGVARGLSLAGHLGRPRGREQLRRACIRRIRRRRPHSRPGERMAYEAWWEHTPTRLPAPDPAAADYPIYRASTSAIC